MVRQDSFPMKPYLAGRPISTQLGVDKRGHELTSPSTVNASEPDWTEAFQDKALTTIFTAAHNAQLQTLGVLPYFILARNSLPNGPAMMPANCLRMTDECLLVQRKCFSSTSFIRLCASSCVISKFRTVSGTVPNTSPWSTCCQPSAHCQIT